ncbi:MULTISPECIES: hypothetical protein [unclassified Synechococcus]|uniref:hypothetical protein n=1 Tax=unclassified Synechococcus TaxID=2626047 RepID=UPI002000B251|nr:hypothetical protein [Synechococcus sp. A10-1-5-1]UPM49433.1 hypothetical protein MY494_08780 [Synechococcus sp. A10-1-5-1]
MKRASAALLVISLGFPGASLAQGNPFGSFEVRTLKRETKHLETGALICALRLEGEGEALIAEAWTMHFPEGPSRDDQLLVNSTIRQLCPKDITR